MKSKQNTKENMKLLALFVVMAMTVLAFAVSARILTESDLTANGHLTALTVNGHLTAAKNYQLDCWFFCCFKGPTIVLTRRRRSGPIQCRVTVSSPVI
ncbi:hypothetical protein QL285_035641 [Trifolium repens]|nr:hypothetical protein QL285_035641 [Trifolium repens]